MKHLAIYYIATSNYKMEFVHFKKNLGSFYPDFRKTVIMKKLQKGDKIALIAPSAQIGEIEKIQKSD